MSEGSAETPMLDGRSLWELVERRAERTPDARCVIDEFGVDYSFAGFRDACERVAAGFAARGIGEGSVVSWVMPTCSDALVLAGALSRLGVVQNPILPILRQREVSFIVRQVGTRLLCVPGVFRKFDYAAMARDVAREADGLEVLSLEDGLPSGDPATLPPPPATPDDPDELPVRWVFYTSGTTSDPKGARHTDFTVMVTHRAMAIAVDLKPDDCHGFAFPVTHIGGIGWLVASLASGMSHVCVAVWDPEKTIPFFASHGITQASAGTAFHQAYLAAQREQPARPLLPKVRAFPGGAAPKPPQLHYDLKNEMGGVGIISGYGLTECPIIAMNKARDPDEKLAHTEGQANPPSAEMRVVKADGSLASPGEEGEIRAFGPQLCKGYVDSSLAAGAFDEQGFFRTGDLGFLDEEGFVVITGRLKDVIIRKGENISAKQVEDLLYQHPKVADVAVIGLPDPTTGERACAVVACEAGERLEFDEMVAFLRGQDLTPQKIPEQLELVDEVPRNPAGKILKKDLRARYVEG